MKTLTRRRLLTLTAALPLAARSQPLFPQRPLRIVVPTPAGGASDTSARHLAQALAAAWGQQVLVDNRPGASGALAAQAVMAATADGHTLLWGLSSMAGLPFVLKAPPYRHLADLAPVAATVQFPYALFVHPAVPAASFAELVAYGRSHPDRLSYATGTLGEYLFGAHVLKAAGVQALRVPYKGGAQLMPDLVSGQVQLNFAPILGGLPQVRAGKLKVLAVLQPQRHALLPEVPSLSDLGLPPAPLPSWNALFAPAGTPREVADRVAQAVNQALTRPELRQTLLQLGAEPVGGSPAQLADAVRSAHSAWQALVQEHAIQAE